MVRTVVAAALGIVGWAAAAAADSYLVAVLQGLDKVTARVSTIEAPVGRTVRFGTLEIIARTASRGPGAAWRHFDYALRGVGWEEDAATVGKAVAAGGWEDFAWSGTKATPKVVAERQTWNLDQVLAQRQDYAVLTKDRYRRPRHFAEKIAALCEAEGIRLYWVFLPALMEKPLSLEQEELYGSLGDGVLRMDRPTIESYFTMPIWHNSGHVSTRGTRFLSR